MYYTYILQSIPTPQKRYVGHTSNLKTRLAAHNAGDCPATRRYRPWRIKVYVAFENRLQAKRFEIYLKTGSGRAFANRHFWA